MLVIAISCRRVIGLAGRLFCWKNNIIRKRSIYAIAVKNFMQE